MITVSSSQGSIGSVTMPMLYWYRSSKAALNMCMKNLALQLKGRGIVVGLVTPGATDTDFMAGLPKKMLRPVADAVTDMMREIDRFDLAMTGQFLGYRGDVLPW
jgi:NAD(P)-dependent dehydrogenase (short-subunit alcohol dehydrogenase family)